MPAVTKYATFATAPVTLREVEIGRPGSECERVALERDAKRRGMKNVYTSMIVA